MHTGAITGYIDVAQLVLYAFWIFFFGIIYYLRREDKREGYPLESDRSERSGGRIKVQGFPAMPGPKTFLLAHGGSVVVPDPSKDVGEIRALPTGPWPGAPLEPTGNPMLDGVGPAAYTPRSNSPDLTFEGIPKIVPLRVATDYSIAKGDPDPRGLPVIGADRNVAGTISDVWVDRSEPQVRYFEVAVTAGGSPRNVLLPVQLARVDTWRRQVVVKSLLAEQFATVPTLSNPDEVSLSEEDRISAYYAGGNLYAIPARLEPLL
jgi:photosynthetic reaction center H subunit